jgi:hypothetical protein
MDVTVSEGQVSAHLHSLTLKMEAASTPSSWWNNPMTESASVINCHKSLESVRKLFSFPAVYRNKQPFANYIFHQVVA